MRATENDNTKHYTAEFKAHVAFEACREDRTLAQLSSEFGVSAEQICRWKKKLQSDAGRIFFITKKGRTRHWEAIGRLGVLWENMTSSQNNL